MSCLPRSEGLKRLVKHLSIRNREEWGSLHVLPRNFVVTKTDLPGKLKIMGNPPFAFGSCNSYHHVGPRVPILSYSHKSGIRPLITWGIREKQIQNLSGKTCAQTKKNDSQGQGPLKICSTIAYFIYFHSQSTLY